MSVVVNNLVKTYGKQNAVNNISFVAKKGEITGFLGPNGAGKSTTMKIITCYTPATSGEVLIAGQKISDDTSLEIRKKIGYLPEHNPLYLEMYVHEYLHLVARLHQIKDIKNRTNEMIMLCGLTREQNKKIGQLSKGYRQRVGLAQALIHDPEVLILDEPTTGLDPNQLVEIRDLIKNISKDKTVILSTHIMQEVQALCNHVVIIDRGNLVANDEVSNLTKEKNATTEVILKFKNKIDPTLFERIDNLLEINYANDSLNISFSKELDLRALLIRFCVEHNLELLEIYTQKRQTIEDVFRTATSH